MMFVSYTLQPDARTIILQYDNRIQYSWPIYLFSHASNRQRKEHVVHYYIVKVSLFFIRVPVSLSSQLVYVIPITMSNKLKWRINTISRLILGEIT